MKKTLDLRFQIITWIVAANLFIIFRFWGRESIPDYLLLFDSTNHYLLAHLNATVTGGITGLAMGFIDYRLNLVFSRKKSFGRTILVKGILYILIIFMVISVTFLTYGLVKGLELETAFWKLTQFYRSRDSLTLMLYCITISFLVSFIKQVSNKFGPGVLLKLFTGKYYNPIQEERIFMFLDLKDSTPYAEKLGHIKYSRLIQDCFHELTDVVPKYKAEIYQYVGDEVVLSWDLKHGLENSNCLRFYFAYKNKLVRREKYFMKYYEVVPVFKGGVNAGMVTVAEVGEIKKEIAYHGDVLNTASRIQSKCNTYGRNLLISEDLHKILEYTPDFQRELIGETELKGKEMKLNIYSVEVTK